MTRPANRFQSSGDRDSIIKLLGLKQTIMRRIKIIALDIQTGERDAMAGRLFSKLMRLGNFAQSFTQGDRSGTALQRGPQALHGAIGRAVFDEQLRVEQSRFDIADRFFGMAIHTLRVGSRRATWPTSAGEV